MSNFLVVIKLPVTFLGLKPNLASIYSLYFSLDFGNLREFGNLKEFGQSKVPLSCHEFGSIRGNLTRMRQLELFVATTALKNFQKSGNLKGIVAT